MVTDNAHDVQDASLWAQGQALAVAHAPDPLRPGHCANSGGGAGYPCLPRRLADRARCASRQGWPQRWTARLDMHSCGISAHLVTVGG
jgi:hypothetical protein